jgi:hypothetical protein
VLARFQAILGDAVRRRAAPTLDFLTSGMRLDAGELRFLVCLAESRGFWFTVGVQRSWCELRARNAARVVLGILPAAERRSLVEAWVVRGGGTASFHATEADRFLDFIAAHLPDPSHALTVCRVEQAIHRATQAAAAFAPEPPLDAQADPAVARGGGAALVSVPARRGPLDRFLTGDGREAGAEPGPEMRVLFAPGLAGLCREASPGEARIWDACAAPIAVSALEADGHARPCVAGLLAAGVLEAGSIRA